MNNKIKEILSSSFMGDIRIRCIQVQRYHFFRICNALLKGTEKRKEKSRFEKQVPATLAGIENTYEENMRKRERK